MTSNASNYRVLIVNTLYAPYRFGGAEVSVQLLAQTLARAGVDVAVYSLAMPDEPASDDELNGVPIYRRPLRNIYWPYQHLAKPAAWRRAAWHLIDAYNPVAKQDFRKLLEEYRPDIIHYNTIAGLSIALLDLARAMNIPSLLTLRDYYYFHPDCRTVEADRNPLKRCIQWAWRSKNRRAYRQLNAVVGISNWILQQHSSNELGDSAERSVIYNPIEQAEVIPENGMGQKETGSPQCTLGYLGRLEPAKGTTWLVQQLASYPGVENIELLIAGEGDPAYVEQLKALSGNLEIHCLGHTDPQAFFQQIDLLMVPSLWDEPFGRVLIEAARFGVSTIASDRGALPELVQTLGRGYIYSPDDHTGFLRVLEEAIGEWRTRPTSAFHLAPFDTETVARSYQRLYQRILATH